MEETVEVTEVTVLLETSHPGALKAVAVHLKSITVVAAHRPGWLVALEPRLGWPVVTVGVRLPTRLEGKHLLGAWTEVAPHMPEIVLQRKSTSSDLRAHPSRPNMLHRWNPSSRTPYIGDSERSAWDAGSKTPGRPDSFMDGPSTSSYSARTPGAYNAASPDFAPPSYSSKEMSAPTPGNPMSAPTPSAISAPTPGPMSAPTPRDSGSGWADTAPTPAPYGAAPTPGASGYAARDPRGGYYQGAPTPAAGYGNPRTPGVWAGDDDEVRYAEPTTP